MANDAFFSLNADDPGLNKVVHDAASWVYLSNELTIVAHNLSSDDVICRHTCDSDTCPSGTCPVCTVNRITDGQQV